MGGEMELDEKRRELDKRKKQQEYKMFLEKQEQERKTKEASPNRLRERLDSARRMAATEANQNLSPNIPQVSPNKGRRSLVRANSSSGFKAPEENA